MQSIKNGDKQVFEAEPDRGWDYSIEGAQGEMAFAKHVDRYWLGAHDYKPADVAGYEIRTRSSHRFDLIIRPHESDEKDYILLTGLHGEFVFRGWIPGKEGRLDKFFRTPNKRPPAYFVPQNFLLDELEIETTNERA